MSDYSEKLKDPRWQKKRLLIFERDKWTCQACEKTTETLHVHHLIYAEGEPWDSLDDHLETLCRSCHEWRGEFNERWGRSLVSTQSCQVFVYMYSPLFDGRAEVPKRTLISSLDARRMAHEYHTKVKLEKQQKAEQEAAKTHP